MRGFAIFCCCLICSGLVVGQTSLEKQIENTKYPKAGNDNLSREWWYSPGGIINPQNNDDYLADETEHKRFSDSMLQHYHEKYQEHLAKKITREKNLLKEPELPEMPKFESPDFDEPNIAKPDAMPKWILNVLLFIVVGVGLVLIFYLIIKNADKFGAKFQTFDEQWNPEIIPSADFESRLANALKKERYREAIRIYFTLILKELIRLSQIKWTRDKTNHEYLITLKNKQFYADFARCIHVFDVVWYGEYEINRTRYEEVVPQLISFLNKLKSHE